MSSVRQNKVTIGLDEVLVEGYPPTPILPWYDIRVGDMLRMKMSPLYHGCDGSVFLGNTMLRGADGYGRADRHMLLRNGERKDLAPETRPHGYVGLRKGHPQ